MFLRKSKNAGKSLRKQRFATARSKGDHTANQWVDLKLFFDNHCVKCFGASGLKDVEKDHIIPIYQGGDNSIENIQPLCAYCNSSKGKENFDYRPSACLVLNKPTPNKYILF